jgi:hypothetical protein
MDELWSEWFEHKPGDPCPIPWAKDRQYEMALRGGSGSDRHDATSWQWEAITYAPSAEIVGYRYLLSAAPAGFVPPGEKPWYPPQQEGFGEWREHDGGKSPRGVLPLTECLFIFRYEREQESFVRDIMTPESGLWGNGSCRTNDVVAYCVKLEDQPTAAEVEATQQPWTLEQDAADFAADEANRLMLERDGDPEPKPVVTPAPGFMLEGFRSVEPNLLVVAQFCHRMGRL